MEVGDGRDGEEPQVGGGRLGAGEEGESGAGRFKDGDESRSEDGQAVRAKERRQTNKRMREGKVRQEITVVRCEGLPTCKTERSGRVKGTMGE